LWCRLCTHYSSTEFTNPHGYFRFGINFSAKSTGWLGANAMHAFVDSKPKVKVFIPMYEPLEVTKCNRITAKQLVCQKREKAVCF
jgi:hypothetical protein